MNTWNYYFVFLIMFFTPALHGQHSVAMEWNEVLLEGIRGDFARPTVHARNLFHTSAAMYDAWAVYDDEAVPFFLENTVRGFKFEFEGIPVPEDIDSARKEAISFAMYRILRHRFLTSPGAWNLYTQTDSLMDLYGYDTNFLSLNYQSGNPAALGNYIADKIIEFGFQDGSNEQLGYENTYYESFNDPLIMALPGNPDIIDPNRWQPLTLDIFIDQSGNVIPFNTPDFLSPEWGKVVPFAMTDDDLEILERDGEEYWVYNNPGPPALITDEPGLSDPYKWGFSLVTLWSSHLGKAQDTIIDISPAGIGNIQEYPTSFEEFQSFYDFYKGGDPGQGHAINPSTGLPYEPQMASRSDYGRVLAEFWADGPESETPPGHWFSILNYVSTHPLIEKRFNGAGDIIGDLEWDVKSYLTLAGAVHDCAISAWGIKGYYDYLRPVSAIRYMAEKGQSSDPELPNYDPHGFPLVEGHIEMVQDGDELAGANGENINEIMIYTWRGPDFIQDPENDVADVGWILAKEWWPYQRPSFVSPPFAGYISGHSAFSRAASEVLTFITGDEFFPGGMGIFDAPKNEFLVFEDGPSEDIQLQWATYKDASDQTSLSRIWGGIHPPIDDIPGRKIGEKIGLQSFTTAREYFYNDSDNDGFYSYEECNDDNNLVYPGAPEICDGLDNNCDGSIDEGLELRTYYVDIDGDAFGNRNITLDTCLSSAPEGWTIDDSDCNDNDGSIFPGASDLTDNSIDEDCSGRDASAFSFIQGNLVGNRFLIHYPESINAILEIFDISGKLVQSESIDFSEKYVFVEMQSYTSTGMYIVIIRDTDGKVIFREKILAQAK